MQMWSKDSGAERIMSENADTKEMSESMAVKTIDGNTVSNDKISTNNYKNIRYNNPVSPDFFCADPTAVEKDGSPPPELYLRHICVCNKNGYAQRQSLPPSDCTEGRV